MTSPSDPFEVSSSRDEAGPYVEVLGRRLRWHDAGALAARLLAIVGDDGFTAGRRAALKEARQALEELDVDVDVRPAFAPPPVARGAPTALAPPPEKPALAKPGTSLDPAKLKRFLRVATDDPGAITPLPPPTAQAKVTEPTRRTVSQPPPPPVAPARDDAEEEEIGHDDPAARYVARRATEWWEHAKGPDLDAAVRTQARAISAELYQIAEELRRSDHLGFSSPLMSACPAPGRDAPPSPRR